MDTLIVEDEMLAERALRKLISAHAPFLNVVGSAGNGKEALEMITKLKPQLLFLDINIPVMNGLEVLQQLAELPAIVFTTAYDTYAVKAFEVNSVDYLLKPIEPARFIKTAERLAEIGRKNMPYDKDTLLNILKSIGRDPGFSSITVKMGDRLIFLTLDEITHFFAEDKYVLVNTTESKQYITSFTLQELEGKLPSEFIRISRSVIVNKKYIREAHKLFGKKFTLVLKDTKGSRVDTGGAYVDNFLGSM